jgi:hypothetical protein
MALVLHGFRFSVYVPVARIARAEKGLAYQNVEVDPFVPDVPVEYPDLHPFKRVPARVDGDFRALRDRAHCAITSAGTHCARNRRRSAMLNDPFLRPSWVESGGAAHASLSLTDAIRPARFLYQRYPP